MSKRTILMLTSKDCDKDIVLDEVFPTSEYAISKIYDICDVIPAVSEMRFDILILDIKYCESSIGILSLFKRRTFYVPTIILLSDKQVDIKNIDIKIIDRKDINAIKTIIDNSETNASEKPVNNPFIKTTLEKQLINLGFSKKYKGFDYLVEIVLKILSSETIKKSFSKHLYPYISSLYNVSCESVERDIRNVIKQNEGIQFFKNDIGITFYDSKPTTRNIVNSIVLYIKDYLNKIDTRKIAY